MNFEKLLSNKKIFNFLKKNSLEKNHRFLLNNRDVLEDFYYQNDKPLFPEYKPFLKLIDGRIEIFYKQNYLVSQPSKKFSIGQPENFKKINFSNFELNESRNEAFVAAIKFVKSFPKKYSFEKGIYLWGEFGVGKSFLISALLNELSNKGFETAFVNLASLITRLNQISMREKQRLIKKISKSNILALDDIGAGDLTSWFRDGVIGTILDYRMNKRKPTFFTSNFDINSLREQYLTIVRGVSEPIKAARITERIRFLSKEIQMGGDNRRN